MISSSHKFIFIHLPKTGGNSVQDALRAIADDEMGAFKPHQDGVESFGVRNPSHNRLQKHSTLADYHDALGDKVHEYKIFTTIRNPFDRLVSSYFSPHRGEIRWNQSDFRAFIKSVKPLENFLAAKAGFFSRRIPKVGRIARFLRFERLNEDFAKMCADVSMQIVDLPHRNQATARRDYRDCFDAEMIAWVKTHHRLELALGEYSF